MFLLNVYLDGQLTCGGIPLVGRVTVGRNPDNRVVLTDTSVSRAHAAFVVEKDGDRVRVLLHDLGSTNGCEVNRNVFRGKAVPVAPGDDIRIGTYRAELLRKAPELAGLQEDGDRTILYEGPPLPREPIPVERLKALYELATSAGNLELDALIEAAAGTIVSCLRFDVLCIVLETDGGSEVVRTWNAAGPCDPGEVRVSKKLLGKCLRENLAVLADKKPDPAEWNGEDSGVWSSLSCALCVPLVHGSWNLGAIYLSSDVSALMYDRDDLEFVILVGHQVSSAYLSRKALQDLRAEAQKLEAVVGSLEEGVIVADKDFVVLSANRAARRILRAEAIEGRSIEDVLASFEHSFERTATGARTRFRIVVPHRPDAGAGSGGCAAAGSGAVSAAGRAAGGAARAGGPKGEDARGGVTMPGRGLAGGGTSVYAATVSENAGGGDAWRFVICLHDESHIERNERLKSVFVNRLAHKLRTPLTVIAGVNSLISQQAVEGMDPELRSLLDESVRHAEECSAIIERFVEYTSLDIARGATSRERASVGALIAFAEDATRNDAMAKGFSIEQDLPEEEIEVRGNRGNLAIVFHHIAQNAVKFGREGGRLAIRAEQSGDSVWIRFIDDGPGIPTAELENLCKMLHQVDTGNTGQVPGAGLGLWIVRAIVDSHRGDISIASPAEGDRGTMVEIRLPAASAETDGEDGGDGEREAGDAADTAFSETVPLEAKGS